MGVIIEETTNMLEHFGVDLRLLKNETVKRIDQLEKAFATALKNLKITYKKKFQDAKVKMVLMLLN